MRQDPIQNRRSYTVHFHKIVLGNGPKHLTLGFFIFLQEGWLRDTDKRGCDFTVSVTRSADVKVQRGGGRFRRSTRQIPFSEGDSRRRRGSPKRPFEGPLYTGRTPDSSADKAAFVTPTNRVPNPTATASESRRRKTVLPRMIVAHLLSGQVLHAQQPLSRKPTLKPFQHRGLN